jgi:hypothetical protein
MENELKRTMTYEELKKVPFRFVSHLSMEDEHCTVYESKDKRISFCNHVHFKNGEPTGRTYRHYMIDGKVYKTKEKFIEALEKI